MIDVLYNTILEVEQHTRWYRSLTFLLVAGYRLDLDRKSCKTSVMKRSNLIARQYNTHAFYKFRSNLIIINACLLYVKNIIHSYISSAMTLKLLSNAIMLFNINLLYLLVNFNFCYFSMNSCYAIFTID